MDRAKIVSAIKGVLRANGIRKAYLFGSFARNERNFHDIDIAIEAPKGKFSLLDLIGVEQEIAGKVKKKVDLVTVNSLSPHFAPYIKKDMVLLYEGG